MPSRIFWKVGTEKNILVFLVCLYFDFSFAFFELSFLIYYSLLLSLLKGFNTSFYFLVFVFPLLYFSIAFSQFCSSHILPKRKSVMYRVKIICFLWKSYMQTSVNLPLVRIHTAIKLVSNQMSHCTICTDFYVLCNLSLETEKLATNVTLLNSSHKVT